MTFFFCNFKILYNLKIYFYKIKNIKKTYLFLGTVILLTLAACRKDSDNLIGNYTGIRTMTDNLGKTRNDIEALSLNDDFTGLYTDRTDKKHPFRWTLKGDQLSYVKYDIPLDTGGFAVIGRRTQPQYTFKVTFNEPNKQVWEASYEDIFSGVKVTEKWELLKK